MFSRKKFARKNFSLIELLIVIGIMGALAALILPAFSDSETAAKDTACDYNQAGTLRYLTMFRAANGVYPSGFHTGANDMTATQTLREPDDGDATTTEGSALTTCAEYNFGTASAATALDANMVSSLQNAGIVTLASGRSVAEKIDTTTKVYVVNSTGAYWTEALDAVTGEVNASGDALECRNASLQDIAAVGQADGGEGTTADPGYDVTSATNSIKAAVTMRSHTVNTDGTLNFTEGKFKIVPFYVAPTIDWEHYYSDGPNDSKISVAMAGKCPWGEGGQARYYIAFFKVYDDGSAAKLLCTSCPDCGILDGDMF